MARKKEKERGQWNSQPERRPNALRPSVMTIAVLTGTTDSLPGNITNNASVVIDQATAGTYGGVISGTGTLTKEGVVFSEMQGRSADPDDIIQDFIRKALYNKENAYRSETGGLLPNLRRLTIDQSACTFIETCSKGRSG